MGFQNMRDFACVIGALTFVTRSVKTNINEPFSGRCPGLTLQLPR